MGCPTSKETVTTGQQGHGDYGGDYPFVDKMYSSSVKVKDLLSWTEQRVLEVLDWTEFSLRPDGNFRRDGESTDVFPIAGISIKWRYDPTGQIIPAGTPFHDPRSTIRAWSENRGEAPVKP